MSEDVKPSPSPEEADRSFAQILAAGLQAPPDRPSWAERADTFMEPALRAWLRICKVIASGLGVAVLVMLVFLPDSVPTIIKLIELIISSGRGFAIPTVVLVTLLPRLLRPFAGRREQAGPQDPV